MPNIKKSTIIVSALTALAATALAVVHVISPQSYEAMGGILAAWGFSGLLAASNRPATTEVAELLAPLVQAAEDAAAKRIAEWVRTRSTNPKQPGDGDPAIIHAAVRTREVVMLALADAIEKGDWRTPTGGDST